MISTLRIISMISIVSRIYRFHGYLHLQNNPMHTASGDWLPCLVGVVQLGVVNQCPLHCVICGLVHLPVIAWVKVKAGLIIKCAYDIAPYLTPYAVTINQQVHLITNKCGVTKVIAVLLM
jgi:hypothetical protein